MLSTKLSEELSKELSDELSDELSRELLGRGIEESRNQGVEWRMSEVRSQISEVRSDRKGVEGSSGLVFQWRSPDQAEGTSGREEGIERSRDRVMEAGRSQKPEAGCWKRDVQVQAARSRGQK
jgi:hypothetical protein